MGPLFDNLQKKKNGFGAQHLPTFVWPLNDVLGGGHYRAPMSMSSEFTSSAERGGTRDAKGSALVMARRCPAVVPALWKGSSKKVDTSESVWDACAPSQPQTHSESLSQK